MMKMMTESKLEKTDAPRQSILWIDGVGGYQLVDRDEVTLGQAIASSLVDVGIVGDVSRQAGVIRRTDHDYLLQPLQSTLLNGQAVARAQLLRTNDVIQFGARVKLRFTQPNPLTATARLDLLGLGRFQPHVDAVLLLADSCIIGPRSGSHVLCPSWSQELLLIRRSEGWFFRSQEELEVNGRPGKGQVAAQPGLRMCGADFSLSIE